MIKNIKEFIRTLRREQNLDKLIKRGLIVGKNFTRMSGVIIDPSHCWHIAIGNDVILAPNVHILAHDASTKVFLNYTKVANVNIGNRVFIGAGAIILPGVNIGDDVIVGAGSIVTKSISNGKVVAGNPAKEICSTETYLNKIKNEMNNENCLDSTYTLRNKEFGKREIEKTLDIVEKYGYLFIE